MRVHHINCGTMCPFSQRLVNGEGSAFAAGRMVCHCLLIESDDGLVLVDTGVGVDDIRDARKRLGSMFLLAARPKLDESETAIRQVERLGFKRRDVRHIVVTHLDLDHAGGLADFPDAKVHVHDLELDSALARITHGERARYVEAQWAHGPQWARHTVAGESWFGFDAVRAIDGVDPEVLLVPLYGHTRGHAGVAVRTGGKWLLHAGDAYFYFGEIDPERHRSTPALKAFQKVIAIDDKVRLENQARLRELVRARSSEVEIISAHCPVEFARHEARGPREIVVTRGAMSELAPSV